MSLLDTKRAAAAILAIGLTCAAVAQPAFPARPINVIVGLAAGGPTDTVARTVAQVLSDKLGQSVVVDNKPGAAGVIAAEQVAKAKPDGYTLMWSTSSITTWGLTQDLRFNPVTDLTPIAAVGAVPLLLLFRADTPFKTIDEFVSAARAAPGKYQFGSAGTGSAAHLAGEVFAQGARIDVLHVPYKGTAPALTDLFGGRIDFVVDATTSAIPQIRGGKAKALAVLSRARYEGMPEVPSAIEKNLAQEEGIVWFALLAPKDTPKAVVQALSNAVKDVVSDPVVVKKLNDIGASPFYLDSAALGDRIEKETRFWGDTTKRLKIDMRSSK